MDGISRRTFLRSMGIYSLALLVNACFPRLDMKDWDSQEPDTTELIPDLEFSLQSVIDEVQIFPGEKTEVMRFRGKVIKGDPSNLVTIEGSYLGPIFHVRKGQIVRIHYTNQLKEKSIVHWHGLHVPVEADGHPRLAIEEGETYTYTFTVMDRAGTYWYHPHPHGRTGAQVYAGLAGLFIIHDAEEDGVNLPQGEYDLPFVIQDRIFSSSNQLMYKSQMMEMYGFLGNQILINGLPDINYAVKKSTYRFRLHNGSNARIYKVAWDDGSPLTVIGTDGGLLEQPIEKDFVTLSPAQRVDVWADFSGEETGTLKQLISLPHSAPGGIGSFPLLSFEVGGVGDNASSLPDRLSVITWEQASSADNFQNPRKFSITMGRGMQFLLNGKSYQKGAVDQDEKVKLGDLEIWEFENSLNGMGMMHNMNLPHPMHIHGLQFKILERDWINVDGEDWSDLAAGCVDEGWHDTVLVYPGERVKLLMCFEDFTGLYLYHCHNLEHEDMGMMRNYLVET